MSVMGNTGDRLMSWEGKVIAGLGGVACALAILWLTNMWNAIESERKARADMQNSISSSYMTKEASLLIAASRERQIEAIVQRLDRVQNQLQALDKRLDEMK
jgi:hypothetical protein